MSERSIWMQAINWLADIERRLPAVWPSDLPPASDPAFWETATRLEMQERTATTEGIRLLIATGAAPSSMTPLKAWFYRRRAEWAHQLIAAKIEERVEPSASLADVLDWLLVRSWDSDGCIAFWNHAIERGGQPPPGTPPL